MKSHELLEVIGDAQDSYVLDAKAPKKKSTPVWVKWVAMAACLILGIGLAIPQLSLLNPNNDDVTGPGTANPSLPSLQGGENLPVSDSLNYGQVNFLSVINKSDASISGEAFQYIVGTPNPGTGIQGEAAPPLFEFQHGTIHVVARAVEELGVYEKLNEYGSTRTFEYRLFRMEVINPLQSGLEGVFYYLLPGDLAGNLTQYDALLISMTQLPVNFVLRSGDELKAFDYLFCDPQDAPELGNMIAFTDGVFDESLWQDKSWFYGYQFGKRDLDENDGRLLVSRGSTLEEALQRRQSQIEEWGEWAKYSQVKHYDFQAEEAQAAMDYLKPFENGVFVPEQRMPNYCVRRYINGCPTNEWISIDYYEETVTSSEYYFEDVDFEKLPDLSAYIESLDMMKIAPQHTNTTGKILIYNSVVGWYEKTENGVYSIVRIAWRYYDQDDYYVEYYDETFILLDEAGDHIVSREELLDLIGENRNISYEEYGVGIDMPMA